MTALEQGRQRLLAGAGAVSAAGGRASSSGTRMQWPDLRCVIEELAVAEAHALLRRAAPPPLARFVGVAVLVDVEVDHGRVDGVNRRPRLTLAGVVAGRVDCVEHSAFDAIERSGLAAALHRAWRSSFTASTICIGDYLINACSYVLKNTKNTPEQMS